MSIKNLGSGSGPTAATTTAAPAAESSNSSANASASAGANAKSLDLGAGMKLELSNQVQLEAADGNKTWVAMPAGYPLVEEQGASTILGESISESTFKPRGKFCGASCVCRGFRIAVVPLRWRRGDALHGYMMLPRRVVKMV